jgi:PAP2 superfamily
MKKHILLFCSVFLFSFLSILSAQTSELQKDLFSDSSYTFYPIDSTTYFAYQRPGALQHFPNCLVDVYDYSVDTFSKENLPTLAWVAASTAILLVLDQAIVDEAQRFGDHIGLEGTNNLKKIGNIFGFPIQVPTDLPSALYFIGDGWTDTALMATFLTYGLIDDNVRSLQTASQLAEGILATTIVTQFLKHITGRETPIRASEPGGKWRPFPNQIKYHKNVPKYDAYPSGHLAAGIATLEIIAENYKEYKFIRPVGYTLLTILCYQMLNNGVHWASDYPLAFVMGYSISQMILNRNRRIIHTDGQTGLMNNIELGVGVGNRSQLALILSYKF